MTQEATEEPVMGRTKKQEPKGTDECAAMQKDTDEFAAAQTDQKDTSESGKQKAAVKENCGNGAAVKFVLLSALGIFMFFVQIRIGDEKSIPVDYLIAALKKLLADYYTWVVLALSACALILRIRRRGPGKNAADWAVFLQSLAGFALCLAVAAGIGPESFLAIGRSAITATGNIVCAIFVAALFIPLLTEYGLVDAAGVICHPFMRKVFLTPGSSAVIGVSAFLGNFSLGHVISRQMYDEGKYTEKEAVIVAMGFSTCSIGLMINLANYMGIMPYWTLYVGTILVITFVTTALVSRVFPISRKRETYADGRAAVEEKAERGHVFRRAWEAGISRAGQTTGICRAVARILARVFPLVCEVTATSVFVIVCGLAAAEYTDLFYWIGSFVRPILGTVAESAEELYYAVSAIGASVFEPVIAGIVCDGQEISMVLKWVAAVVPYTAIVFFAGFIPSAVSSGVPCKIWEMLVVWAERVLISTVLALAVGLVLFG